MLPEPSASAARAAARGTRTTADLLRRGPGILVRAGLRRPPDRERRGVRLRFQHRRAPAPALRHARAGRQPRQRPRGRRSHQRPRALRQRADHRSLAGRGARPRNDAGGRRAGPALPRAEGRTRAGRSRRDSADGSGRSIRAASGSWRAPSLSARRDRSRCRAKGPGRRRCRRCRAGGPARPCRDPAGTRATTPRARSPPRSAPGCRGTRHQGP